jgi:pimeloyl-ACP methyl ester carboxylesterase
LVSESPIPFEERPIPFEDRPIPYDEFGDHGPTLHFAHANAYPPGAYRQLLGHLAKDFRVLAIKYRPLWPESNPEEIDNWQDIAQDLILFLDQMKISGVIGVGHSLGAVTTMMAALQRPDLFKSLVLIEPVFLPPSVLEHFSQQQGFDPYEMPLIKIAQKRRHHWDSLQGAFDHFRGKRVFSRWSDQALWDYINAGLNADGQGEFELAFSPAWEAWIYAHPPMTVWDLISEVTKPTLALRGVESDTLVPEAWETWREKQPEAAFIEITDTGHLLPMEKPVTVADLTGEFLKGLS